jgi:midasin
MLSSGKRELPSALRNRFTEVYVAEYASREDLRGLVATYLRNTVPNPPLDSVVDFYLATKAEMVRLQSPWVAGRTQPV